MSSKEVIEHHYAASDRGDIEGMLESLSETIVWTEAAGFPLAGTYTGPAEVAEKVFAGLQRDWEGFSLTIDEVLDAGDTVVGVGTYRGTSRTSGKSFEARVVHLWRVENGKAVRFEQITDSALVVAALS